MARSRKLEQYGKSIAADQLARRQKRNPPNEPTMLVSYLMRLHDDVVGGDGIAEDGTVSSEGAATWIGGAATLRMTPRTKTGWCERAERWGYVFHFGPSRRLFL
jgi:hypothetical protein